MDEGKEKLDRAYDNLERETPDWMRLRSWWERRHGHSHAHGGQRHRHEQGRHS